MEQLFLTILNRAVTAGWLVLLVMVLRVVLKKAPTGGCLRGCCTAAGGILPPALPQACSLRFVS